MTTLSETEFETKYVPVPAPDSEPGGGDLIWQHKDTLRIPLRHVWTIMEDDYGNGAYAVPGYHIVNKIDYLVTEIPWTDETEQGVWWPARPLCLNCCDPLDEDSDPWIHNSGERKCYDGDSVAVLDPDCGWKPPEPEPLVVTRYTGHGMGHEALRQWPVIRR